MPSSPSTWRREVNPRDLNQEDAESDQWPIECNADNKYNLWATIFGSSLFWKKVVDAFFLEKWLWSLFGDLINEKFFLLGLEHALTLAIILQNYLNPSSLRPAKSFPLFLLSKRVHFNLNTFLCSVKQLFPCNRLPFAPLFYSHQRVLILIPTTALFLSDCFYLQSTWTALRYVALV